MRLQFSEKTQLYLYLEPVDMRKAIDGLAVLIMECLSINPQCGHVFIFNNRSRDKVKLLVWDKNGFTLFYKRLEKGRFKWPRESNGTHIEIDQKQLEWLLAGIDFMQLSRHESRDFLNYF